MFAYQHPQSGTLEASGTASTMFPMLLDLVGVLGVSGFATRDKLSAFDLIHPSGLLHQTPC